MNEIDLMNLKTDDPDFLVMRAALLKRHDRLVARHRPGGPVTCQRTLSPREKVASAFTPVILDHTHTIVAAFGSSVYSSAFALVRPTMEGLLKQMLVIAYKGSDSGWKDMIDERPKSKSGRRGRGPVRVNENSLRKLASLDGWPDGTALWNDLAPWLNEFAHGGISQLKSNHDVRTPRYPAHWFYDAMLICTVVALSTSASFWSLLGHNERATSVMRDMAATDWDFLVPPDSQEPTKIIKPQS